MAAMSSAIPVIGPPWLLKLSAKARGSPISSIQAPRVLNIITVSCEPLNLKKSDCRDTEAAHSFQGQPERPRVSPR